jgi:cytidylate kinase
MNRPQIVTIDGPAGVGKTTLAKRLAGRLGLAYLDTGAMYRGVAHALGEGAWDLPEDDLAKALDNLVFSLTGQGAESELRLNGVPLGAEIRTEEVAAWASNMARLPAVRVALVRAQQAMGRDTALVAEGRDMGTVVFPEARHKFFLEADPRVRAKRRCLQLEAMGQDADEDEIYYQIRKRDEQDRNRSVAPLKPADDAMIIDTTDKDLDQVFAALLGQLP